MKDKHPEISVIVPVYNVGAYLDICMSSLLDQTFPDMEILLINDGSTDDSGARCLFWAEKDARIRYIEKTNGGVSSARNLGIKEAGGKYLAFIDPDDWVERTYMEKLHARLDETGADFAECDLWRYDNRTGKMIYRSCYGHMGQEYTLRERMKYGPTAIYKSMFRRDLWQKYDLRMPDCTFENPAVYSLIVALSGKVESIHEPLYYYRRFRENSLIESYSVKDEKANNTLGIEAMKFLISEYKRCGIYDQFADTLEGVVKYRLNDILAMQFHRKSPEDFELLVSNCRKYLADAFPNGHNEKYITWGGYNLNRILTHMNWLHDPSCRFNFSSIISICSEPDPDDVKVSHNNRYRQIMLEREKRQTYWKILNEAQPVYLFIDLLEERFDLLRHGGHIVTKSDAYDECTFGTPLFDLQRIPRSGEYCTELWEKSASDFISRTKAAVPGIRIVILENYLCERCGDLVHLEEFQNIEFIRETNALLKRYYDFLKTVCPDAVVIAPSGDPLYFTDKNYEYGAVPSHLNEIVNQNIAERLESIL